jgi:BirA family biotin operon repressor/biotin-[acetyl-CoA-carboxylase] ligase
LNEIQAVVSSPQLDITRVRDLLETSVFGIGDRLVFVPQVDSTNTLALELARSGSEEGVVVLTNSQPAGKGRQGRRWVDRSGHNALSSTLLYPSFPPYFLVMIAAVAVVDAIADTCGLNATIKWPNDVLIGERKVSGILIETSHDRFGRLFAIVGIGVNVNGEMSQLHTVDPSSLPLVTNATTLQEECGYEVSREHLLARLLRHIETMYLALQQETLDPTMTSTAAISRLIRERWRNQLSTLGRTTQVRQGTTLLSGVAEDVNEQGELLLRTLSGACITITWGDVGSPSL